MSRPFEEVHASAPITHFFPPFGSEEIARFRRECQIEELSELNRMFEVADVIDARAGAHVLSTSLYCWPHDPEKPRIAPITLDTLKQPHPGVRNGESWWSVYFLPLLRQLDEVEEPWKIRIHLAPDIEFLAPYLRHPKVEIRIMRHNSVNTVPGMLWRYLPLEDRVTMMARGTDSLWPMPRVKEAMQRMLEGPNVLFRWIRPADIDANLYFVYRSIPGPILCKPELECGLVEAAMAWIWHQKKGLWPTTVDLDGPNDETFEIPKFALNHWARYGQDEQFLSHWLYYLAAKQGIHTVVDRDNNSGVWPMDSAYVTAANPNSRVEMYPKGKDQTNT